MSLGVAAVAFAVYVRTLCPSVPGGDSGELVQVALDAGVVHPPGYPTWTMLAYLSSWLPVGDLAWRLNLSSALFDALACGCLSAAVGLWGGCAWTGAAAGGAFGFSPLVWLYATQAEVFALNNLCNALLLLLLVRFDIQVRVDRSRSLRAAAAGAWAIGLALTNQHTMVLFCAPYALWSLGRGGIYLLRPRALAALCAAGLLGLSPYLYLVSHGGATAAWGSWGYHRSLSGLWTHVTRGEYGTFRLASIDEATNTQTWLRITAYLTSLPGELPAGGPVLAAVGLLRSLALQRLRPLGLLLVCAWLLYIGIFFTLSNLPVDSPFYLQIQQRFWPQPNLYVAAWFALGVRAAVEMVAAPWLSLPAVRRWRLTRIPTALAAVALVYSHARTHWAESDQSTNTIFVQFGRALLAPLPTKGNVMLLTYGDDVINTVRYVRRNLKEYDHVTIVDLNYIQFDWHVDRARLDPEEKGIHYPGSNYGSNKPTAFLLWHFLHANYANWSVFVAGGMPPADDSWKAEYKLWPLGMVSQVLRSGAAVALDKWASRSKKALPRLSWEKTPLVGSWEHQITNNHYREAYQQRGWHCLQHAYEMHGEGGDEEIKRFSIAARVYDEMADVALNASMVLESHFYRNMGVAFSQLVRLEPTAERRAQAKQRAAQAFLRYLKDPNLAESDRVQIEDGILHLVPRGEGEGYHKMERQMLEQERTALRGDYEQKARDRAQTAEWQRQQLEMAKAQEAQASQRRRAEATIKEGMKAPQKAKKPAAAAAKEKAAPKKKKKGAKRG